jgi:N-acetyl-gamma-glutamyl-phosphate reductase
MADKYKKRVAVAGGSGYAGGELIRLIKNHTDVELTVVTSQQHAGKTISEVFPHLHDDKLVCEPLDIKKFLDKADLFFLALPHKTSQAVVASLVEAGKDVVDLSADYRLKNTKVYEKWYKTPHNQPEILKKAVYGLPELYRKKLKKSHIVANPGCYPTSAILGLIPLMDKKNIDDQSIIIDSKSGISGAGRKPSLPLIYGEVNDSLRAYSVATHRHTPEIEQELSIVANKKIKVTFTPHVVPMDRGILSTIYIPTDKKKMPLSRIRTIYEKFYHDEPFVRILKDGELPTTKAVRGTNYCDIALSYDKRKGILIIISAIDNLIKGASGQALQNMNIMYGFDERTGLNTLSTYP